MNPLLKAFSERHFWYAFDSWCDEIIASLEVMDVRQQVKQQYHIRKSFEQE